jgi:uncharacterized repeat protein (TIGR03803 family)
MVGRLSFTSCSLILALLSMLPLIANHTARAQTETVLFNFPDNYVRYPVSRLTPDGRGDFYATTAEGDPEQPGTVFELSPNGSGEWSATLVYAFTGGTDGSSPQAGLIVDAAGNLYGTTEYGGANGAGVVFTLSPNGTGWTETVLYNFCSIGGPYCTDGEYPHSNLIMDDSGNLYGTTLTGGSGEYGTVFQLSPSAGGWTEQVIYSPADSADYWIISGVTMDAAGNLFGATASTVFELSPNGSGGWNPTVLHTFAGGAKDGTDPRDAPVADNAGNVFGTTYGGGPNNLGTVYKLSPITKGKNKGEWKEEILHFFKGSPKDGNQPWAGIVLDAAGNIYGTSRNGGPNNYGTVFEIFAPVGKGSYKEKVLWNFDWTDGWEPEGGLILDNTGKLFGTTYYGGSNGTGVVFEVNPSAAATTTTLTSSPNPSSYGQAVTFAALVSSSAGAPPDGETVSFMKGKTVLGLGTLSGGSANFTTPTLKIGTATITAVYGGDFYSLGSKSNSVKQVVTKP